MKTLTNLLLLVITLLCYQKIHASQIAHWQFEGNLNQSISGGSIFYGGTGYSFSPGIVGDAVSLGGGSSFLDLGTNSQTILPWNSDYTVSLWFNADSAQNQNLISFDDDTGWYLRTAIYTDSTGIRGAYTNGSDQTTTVGFDTAYVGNWTHVALSQDLNNGSGQTVITLYVNGQQVSSNMVAYSPLPGKNLDTGAVGRYHIFPTSSDILQSSGALNGHGSNFAGLIDNLIIWDEPVDGSVISAIYASEVPEPSTLLFSTLATAIVFLPCRQR